MVAIVEEIEPDRADVGFMDYLGSGRTIVLGVRGRLVLGYLNSCLREVILGGTVVVGAEKSTVEGGKVSRERVECDGGRLLLTAEQAGKSAVVVFRKRNTVGQIGASTPSLVIYGLQPIIHVESSPLSVTIERLDREQSTIQVTLRDGVADIGTQRISLERGGVYRASGGSSSRVFKVDENAAERGPVIGRLISF